MSLIPKQHVKSMVVIAHSMLLNQIKGHWFQEQIFCVPLDIKTMARNTLIQRPTRPNGSISIDIPSTAVFLTKENLHCIHLGHWWLWIVDVLKKAFYVLDPVNKKKKEIPDLKIKLNKFVVRTNGLPDKGLRWEKPLMEDGEGEEA
ncbi:hypothetical protein Ahy_A04g020122 [Arachis hypogaea]|uniref:Ubiquitin-like protease family profile domain-containing protein n=1 Tax=Arachis hypogaea TaxID=3818 RepID=A0A445DH42_ARAHY|nr:hypothetical protein Ahy_A04g020122 [Arachis hypogaea]